MAVIYDERGEIIAVQRPGLNGMGDWWWEMTHPDAVAQEASSAPNVNPGDGAPVVDMLGNIYLPDGRMISGTTGDVISPSGTVRSGTGAVISEATQQVGAAVDNVVQTAKDAAGRLGGVFEGLGTVGKWLVVGVVAVAAIEAMSFAPRPRR